MGFSLPGGTPYDGLYGKAPPERGTFSRLQAYKKGWYLTSWSMQKGREICHLDLWKGPKELTDKFYDFIKTRKRSVKFVIDSYLKDDAFTAVKRDWCKFLNRVSERGSIRQ